MVQTRRTLQDHLPQLKTLPSTLGAATPGDFVPKMEPLALNAGSTFFTWALFRVILSAPMPHRFYSPSPEATFSPPPMAPGCASGPFFVPHPWAGVSKSKAKATFSSSP